MIHIRRHALVRHSPEEMFDLVNDVEAYPTLFPWCAAARVLARESDSVQIVRLDLRFAGFTQSFTTRNTGERPRRLRMHLVEGPLKSLDGEFTFTALGALSPESSLGSGQVELPPAGRNDDGTSAAKPSGGCKIALALDFEYAGRLIGPALKLGFQGLANRMVDDFSRAAAKRHG